MLSTVYVVLAVVQLAFAWPAGGGRRAVGIVLAVVLVAAAAYFRPRTVPAATAREGELAAAGGRVVVYHRPGCVYCARLMASLGRARERAVWVDIWADPDAAAFVRGVNGGDETVPTVVIDGVALTNPAPSRVKAALAATR